MSRPQSPAKTLFLTLLALIAFAANSVVGRMALLESAIDAASFTSIRLLSGALVLFTLLKLSPRKNLENKSKGSVLASLMLFVYALSFSLAYLSLETGTGALILFGSVQVTMILISLVRGTRLHRLEWFGLTISFSGFVILVLPGVSAPPLLGFALMACAGIAWGIYTLKGRGSENPLSDTAYNFCRTLPGVGILIVFRFQEAELSVEGVVLASLSGGLTSGLGYTLWYMALRGLSVTQAAVVQLSVPVIAALGGVIFVSEIISSRLLVSGLMILGGIFVLILGKTKIE